MLKSFGFKFENVENLKPAAKCCGKLSRENLRNSVIFKNFSPYFYLFSQIWSKNRISEKYNK